MTRKPLDGPAPSRSGLEIPASGTHQFTMAETAAEVTPPRWLDYDPETTTPTLRERTITAARWQSDELFDSPRNHRPRYRSRHHASDDQN